MTLTFTVSDDFSDTINGFSFERRMRFKCRKSALRIEAFVEALPRWSLSLSKGRGKRLLKA